MCQLLHNTQFSQSDFNLGERLTRRICRLNDCSDGKFLRLLGRLFHNFGPRYLNEWILQQIYPYSLKCNLRSPFAFKKRKDKDKTGASHAGYLKYTSKFSNKTRGMIVEVVSLQIPENEIDYTGHVNSQCHFFKLW